MEELHLDVQTRKEIGSQNIKGLRRENFVPAVVYGGKKNPTPIKVDRRQYERIMRSHKGQSVIFHLNVMEGEKKLHDYTAIVKEEQYHPVRDSLLHLDFQRISLEEQIEVKVPVLARGEAVGVKRDGGSLDQPLRELDVVCLPTNIPENIVINVEMLKIGDAIHVKDILLPNGVKTKHDPEAIVLSVVASMKEAVDVPSETGPQEPEVLKEKKIKATEAKAEEK